MPASSLFRLACYKALITCDVDDILSCRPIPLHYVWNNQLQTPDEHIQVQDSE